MRKNLPVTNNEVKLDGDSCILSTTNLKGQITYINKDFIDISGFSKEELIGEPHNIIRHPDMPSAAFDDLWQHLKDGKSWMGMVKNRCKNGDYYWVNAYAVPITEDGIVKEYQSIRTRARPDDIKRAEEVYTRLKEDKTVLALKAQMGIRTQLLMTTGAALLPLFIAAMSQASISGIVAASLISLAVGFSGINYFTLTISKAAAEARNIAHNPMMQYIYTGDTSETGQIMFTLRKVSSELKAVVGRLKDSSEHLSELAHSLDNDIALTEKGVSHQGAEVESAAAAINELAASAHEVSQNASMAAVATETASQETATSSKVVDDAIILISELADEVNHSAMIIGKLKEDSNEIGSVLDVIKHIADQTNLLALNAAIEAARAGDQGRGFAVVADEVRTLASRTAASTKQIQIIIEQIQTGANNAVNAMETSQVKANSGVNQVGKAGESLTSISNAVWTITDMNTQIAAAAKEQSKVAEDVNERVSTIKEVNELTVDSMHSTQKSSQELSLFASNLHELAEQFWHK